MEDPRFLFVYGTLKRTGYNHKILEESPLMAGFAQTREKFLLYDLGVYPAAVLDDNGGPIYGEVFRVNTKVFGAVESMERGAGYVPCTVLASDPDNHYELPYRCTAFVAGPEMAARLERLCYNINAQVSLIRGGIWTRGASKTKTA